MQKLGGILSQTVGLHHDLHYCLPNVKGVLTGETCNIIEVEDHIFGVDSVLRLNVNEGDARR